MSRRPRRRHVSAAALRRSDRRREEARLNAALLRHAWAEYYWETGPNGPWTEIARTNGSSYADTTAPAGVMSYYRVAANYSIDWANVSLTNDATASIVRWRLLERDPSDMTQLRDTAPTISLRLVRPSVFVRRRIACSTRSFQKPDSSSSTGFIGSSFQPLK